MHTDNKSLIKSPRKMGIVCVSEMIEVEFGFLIQMVNMSAWHIHFCVVDISSKYYGIFARDNNKFHAYGGNEHQGFIHHSNFNLRDLRVPNFNCII